MYFSDNGLVIVYVIIGSILVYCEQEKDIDYIKDDDFPEDIYSFIALIDVVYIDGSKQTCTGSIIHDNVVITTAHCIKIDGDFVQAELTSSFVVIGTKKMFDTGYEQYLPIERVIIHPDFSGWTADLALIHTFAGMMSDKPGRIIPLATEKTSAPVFSDVIVLSWGQYKLNDAPKTFITQEENITKEKGVSRNTLTQETTTQNVQIESEEEKLTRSIPFDSLSGDDITSLSPKTLQTTYLKRHKRPRQRRKKTKRKNKIRLKMFGNENQEQFNHKVFSIETRSKYRPQKLSNSHRNLSDYEGRGDQLSLEKKSNTEKTYLKVHTTKRNSYSQKTYGLISYYRNNWRRIMGDDRNRINIEVFGFVNMQTCKKLIEKATTHRIENFNEILCYASEKHFITETDTGAPAIRRGHLIAVTIAGIDFEGERVAVGIKISCFCTWISENIPKSGTYFECCKNCCNKKDEKEDTDLYMRSRKKKL